MYDWDGKICWFGTDNRTNTTVHVVEDWMDLPYMPDRYAWAEGPDGEPKKVVCRKAPVGARDFYRKDAKCQKVFDESGILCRGQIGQSAVAMMTVKESHRLLREAIVADPCVLLKEENPADPWTNEARTRTIEFVRGKYGAGK
jgi:aminoglycoside N3'-acetyltransferase